MWIDIEDLRSDIRYQKEKTKKEIVKQEKNPATEACMIQGAKKAYQDVERLLDELGEIYQLEKAYRKVWREYYEAHMEEQK